MVLRKHGYLLFSASKTGEEALRRYLQRAADRYFEPHAHDGALEIYEYSGRRRELMPHINGGGHSMSARKERKRQNTSHGRFFPPGLSTASNQGSTTQWIRQPTDTGDCSPK